MRRQDHAVAKCDMPEYIRDRISEVGSDPLNVLNILSVAIERVMRTSSDRL